MSRITSRRAGAAYPWIVGAVLILTVCSLAVSLVLSLAGELTPPQARLLDASAATWQLGFGALTGLVAGRGR